MAGLPEFDADGYLPVGVHELAMDELTESGLVLGFREPKDAPNWDPTWRMELAGNLIVLCNQLKSVGITEVVIGGSFVENKDHPNDINGFFPCDYRLIASGDLVRDLNLIDPHACWGWSPDRMRSCDGYPKKRLPMWHEYKVELWPDYGQISVFKNLHDQPISWRSAFSRRPEDGREKGLVKLLL